MLIRQSAEDYFETIYMLKQKNGSVRAIDVVNELGFSKPTVSVAMKKFREIGFVTVDDAGHIELTDAGLAIAKKICELHKGSIGIKSTDSTGTTFEVILPYEK